MAHGQKTLAVAGGLAGIGAGLFAGYQAGKGIAAPMGTQGPDQANSLTTMASSVTAAVSQAMPGGGSVKAMAWVMENPKLTGAIIIVSLFALWKLTR